MSPANTTPQTEPTPDCDELAHKSLAELLYYALIQHPSFAVAPAQAA